MEIEYQTIGSILKDGRLFADVAEVLDADKFKDSICADIFKAMGVIHGRGLIIDQITVADYLERNKTLDSIIYDVHTGRTALASIRGLGSKSAVMSYANTVKDYWLKRQTMNLASVMASQSANGRTGLDIIKDARKALDTLEENITTADDGIYDAKLAASIAYDNAAEASAGGIKYTPTGLKCLDAVLKIRKKSLTIVAGRPGMGKTGFIETVALNSARDKYKFGGRVLIVSMEMAVEELTNRIISKICKVPGDRILDGKMTPEEWARYNDAIGEYESLPITIIDVAGLSVQQIRRKAKSILRDGEKDLLIVDYLQLATDEGSKKNRVEEVGAIARGLKIYASETNTPVLAAAQLSRAVEQRTDKRPIISDLRESGNLEQDANNILFIHVDESDNKGIKRIILAKQRSGKTSNDAGIGDFILGWIGEFTQFTDGAEMFKPNK